MVYVNKLWDGTEWYHITPLSHMVEYEGGNNGEEISFLSLGPIRVSYKISFHPEEVLYKTLE